VKPCVLLLIAAVGLQAHVPMQGPAPPALKKTTVEGNLYENSNLGFSFRFPQGWGARTPDDQKSPPLEPGTLLRATPPNSANPMLYVFTKDLKNAFLIRSGADFLAVHAMDMQNRGFEVRQPTRQITYGKLQFHRIDFQSRRKRDRTYQATAVIIVDRVLVGFGAAGMSPKEVDETLRSLETFNFEKRSSAVRPEGNPSVHGDRSDCLTSS
jgi:hypothetical protein